MENDRSRKTDVDIDGYSWKVDVNMNGYIDEDGKYNILSHNASFPKEQGFEEEFDSSVAIVAGVNQDGKRVLISEAALEKNQLSGDVLELTDIENDNSKPIEVKDISEVLSGDMSDNTIITTPRGVVKTAGQIREEARNFTYENSPLANKVKSKRIEAIEFLTKKDSRRYDFKALLRDCLKGYKHSVETIRAIYKVRVLNKEFKHLNANSKRIALNDYLSNKFIEHSAETNESTIDLIALLKNDNNLIDYAVLLKRVLVMAINRNIKLH